MAPTPDPTDAERFEAALQELLQLAQENGVDVEGGWKLTTSNPDPHFWDLQIVRVEYAEGEEE